MISIRLEGDTRRLLQRVQRLSDLDKRRINAALSEALRTSTVKRFATQKGPDGKSWPVSARAARDGGVTLTDTARLRNSIKSKADDTGFAVGTNTIYARTHQLGVTGRRMTIRAKSSRGLIFKIGDRWIRKRQVDVNITIPARPYLGISDDDNAEIKRTIEDALGGD